MDFLQKLTQLEQIKLYKNWQKNNPSSYLVHIFAMIGKEGSQWQIGFYNKDDTITTFESGDANDEFKIQENEKIFKPDEEKIPALKREIVKIGFEKIAEICHTIQVETYKSEAPVKKIIVLQTLKDFGQVFNVSYITRNFKTLNFKIKAENGKVLEHGLHDVFSFDKGENKVNNTKGDE